MPNKPHEQSPQPVDMAIEPSHTWAGRLPDPAGRAANPADGDGGRRDASPVGGVRGRAPPPAVGALGADPSSPGKASNPPSEDEVEVWINGERVLSPADVAFYGIKPGMEYVGIRGDAGRAMAAQETLRLVKREIEAYCSEIDALTAALRRSIKRRVG